MDSDATSKATRDLWVRRQIAGFQRLSGCVIEEWMGLEMALRSNESTADHVFQDPSIRFLQITQLFAGIAGCPRTMGTYQNDMSWGLCIEECRNTAWSEHLEAATDGYFRSRKLTELPLGLVGDVSTTLDDNELIEVCLTVAGLRVRLSAGEVYERTDGGYTVKRPDESILISVGDPPWSLLPSGWFGSGPDPAVGQNP